MWHLLCIIPSLGERTVNYMLIISFNPFEMQEDLRVRMLTEARLIGCVLYIHHGRRVTGVNEHSAQAHSQGTQSSSLLELCGC